MIAAQKDLTKRVNKAKRTINIASVPEEILHEAKRVYLVCTTELPSLHLCREKLAFLRSQDLASRVSILLNRSQKRGQISLDEMEKELRYGGCAPGSATLIAA